MKMLAQKTTNTLLVDFCACQVRKSLKPFTLIYFFRTAFFSKATMHYTILVWQAPIYGLIFTIMRVNKINLAEILSN